MGSRIVSDLAFVAGGGQHATGLIHRPSADRHVAVHRRHPCLIEGEPHRIFPLALPAVFAHPTAASTALRNGGLSLILSAISVSISTLLRSRLSMMAPISKSLRPRSATMPRSPIGSPS